MSKDMAPNLGRFEKVPLRDVWSSEDRSFTPWLATSDNIEILIDALGLPSLEIVKTGHEVGPFRADIVCRASEVDELVLIENQIERSDHPHLGQILTYAAGLEAAYVVWITSKFREEHRAAIDWLNEITTERFNFFAVEIEAWRIGTSLPAPRFNVVAKPNDWARAMQRTTRQPPALGDTQVKEYWLGLNGVLEASGFPLPLRAEPPKTGWMGFKIDARYQAYLNAFRSVQDRRMGVYLSLYGPPSEAIFRLLQSENTSIDALLGGDLEWNEVKPGSTYHVL